MPIPPATHVCIPGALARVPGIPRIPRIPVVNSLPPSSIRCPCPHLHTPCPSLHPRHRRAGAANGDGRDGGRVHRDRVGRGPRLRRGARVERGRRGGARGDGVGRIRADAVVSAAHPSQRARLAAAHPPRPPQRRHGRPPPPHAAAMALAPRRCGTSAATRRCTGQRVCPIIPSFETLRVPARGPDSLHLRPCACH